MLVTPVGTKIFVLIMEVFSIESLGLLREYLIKTNSHSVEILTWWFYTTDRFLVI